MYKKQGICPENYFYNHVLETHCSILDSDGNMRNTVIGLKSIIAICHAFGEDLTVMSWLCRSSPISLSQLSCATYMGL